MEINVFNHNIKILSVTINSREDSKLTLSISTNDSCSDPTSEHIRYDHNFFNSLAMREYSCKDLDSLADYPLGYCPNQE